MPVASPVWQFESTFRSVHCHGITFQLVDLSPLPTALDFIKSIKF